MSEDEADLALLQWLSIQTISFNVSVVWDHLVENATAVTSTSGSDFLHLDCSDFIQEEGSSDTSCTLEYEYTDLLHNDADNTTSVRATSDRTRRALESHHKLSYLSLIVLCLLLCTPQANFSARFFYVDATPEDYNGTLILSSS